MCYNSSITLVLQIQRIKVMIDEHKRNSKICLENIVAG